MKKPKNIAITGASSGLGAALAEHYAAPGVTLHLQGRDRQRLEGIAETCRRRDAVVYAEMLDVTAHAAMERWLTAADAKTPIDLVIANAGVSAGTGIHGEGADQVRRIFAANIDGVVNTVTPLLSAMVDRRHGQIAIMSSLAGLRGLPSCPAYSASKMCVRAYGEGLRGWLDAYGVEVSVICPGYVRTAMTAVNNFPMPFMMSAEKAARIIAGGLAQNKARIAFPWMLYWPMRFLSCLPVWLTDPLFSRLPAKDAVPSLRQ
ncbi:MAG: SDR family NAD(P)-dependent oxidoreductase [Pseudomonadota bacterium]|nr:SDR family NAD(P)-dependent oxidoreductase [Pseudomonadota bacterium]